MSELFVVATPIGNLGDISERALTVLKQVDLIAAEDTRHSKKLLQHFSITTPMVPYHEHNEREQAQRLLAKVQGGASLALISDAGTPLVSDPGYHLVREARALRIPVIAIPGPCALVAALSVSGLPSDRFVFEGFLPAKATQRKERLSALRSEERTLIFYESPHRILASIDSLIEVMGTERQLVLARELTKTYETVYSDSLGAIKDWLVANEQQQKGEMVLLLQGATPQTQTADEAEVERVLKLLLEEMPLKQASVLAAKIVGRSKNEMYSLALRLKADQ